MNNSNGPKVPNKIKKLLGEGEVVYYIPKWHWLTWFNLRHFWKYRFTTFFLSNRRFYYRHGFITRQTHEMVVGKIESIYVKETFWGRIFGYGHIVLQGTGSGTFGHGSSDALSTAPRKGNRVSKSGIQIGLGDVPLDWISKPFELQRQIRSISPEGPGQHQED